MLSQEFHWEKCTRRFVYEDAGPRHPNIGHLNQEIMVGKDTLYCIVVPSLTISSPYPPSPHWEGGGGVGLVAPNVMLSLAVSCDWFVRNTNSALRLIYPLSQLLPVRESHPRHSPIIGLH